MRRENRCPQFCALSNLIGTSNLTAVLIELMNLMMLVLKLVTRVQFIETIEGVSGVHFIEGISIQNY
jgi:hypothetical protein